MGTLWLTGRDRTTVRSIIFIAFNVGRGIFVHRNIFDPSTQQLGWNFKKWRSKNLLQLSGVSNLVRLKKGLNGIIDEKVAGIFGLSLAVALRDKGKYLISVHRLVISFLLKLI